MGGDNEDVIKIWDARAGELLFSLKTRFPGEEFRITRS